MAYIQNQTDDEGQTQQNLTGQAESQPTPPMTLSSGGAQTPTASSNVAQPPTPQQQRGSGRFTNLQKYVQANQGSGQRLASGAQKQIEKTLTPGKKETEKQTGLLQQGLTGGQQALTTGQKIQQEMAAEGFTPQKAVEFAQGAGNVEQVAKMRTGQVVDEAALKKQKEAFEQATANLGQQVAQRGEQVGSETGRIGLLKETFGGRNKGNYTTGQSRLDNLLLQAGPGNLQALSQNIAGQQQNVQRLQEKAAAQGKTLDQVIADEAALAKATQETTAANVEKFKTGLGGQVSGFNQDIENRISSGNEFLDFYNQSVSDDAFKQKYGMSKQEYQFNKDLWNEFGLQRGQQTFNVFNNPDLNLGQVAEIEGRRAQDWRDVANQANVGEYAALAQLKGLTQPEYELLKASDINRQGFTTYSTDNERSIQGRIKAAQDAILNEAAQGGLISGPTQSVGDQYATGHVSLADYLKNADYWTRAALTGSGASTNLDMLRQLGGLMQTAGNAPQNITENAFGAGGNLAQITTLPLTGILSALGGLLSGDQGDAQQDWRYAKQRAVGHGLIDPSQGSFEGSATGQALQNYLTSKGFSNYLTEEGVKTGSTSLADMAKQFGYRSDTEGTDTQTGFYNPLFEREKILQQAGLMAQPEGEVGTQVTQESGPMTAEEALAARNQATTPRLTREQIADLALTSNEAEKAALRQELIGGDRYLTSQAEYQDLLKSATNQAATKAQQDIQDRLMRDYTGTQEFRDLYGNFTSVLGTTPIGLTESALTYFGSRGNQLSPETQQYLNNLQNQSASQISQGLQNQIYGTTADQLGGIQNLNTQDLLNRVTGSISNQQYQDAMKRYHDAMFRPGIRIGI